ncbi:MAG: HEAT repeat domain-containing protein [Endomicrobiia bacterium]|nr:HEAT repeat domain-containing protein [Endomicrobiia bacterium]
MRRMVLTVVAIGLSAFFLQVPLLSQQSPETDAYTSNISKLKDKDPFIRRSAAEALGSLRDQRAVANLTAALRDIHPLVRQSSVDSLGVLRAHSAVKQIGELLISDKESQVRQSAALALGYIGNSDGQEYLVKALDDKEAGVKYSAAASLGQIRSPEAVAALSKALSDSDAGMRRSALVALDRTEDLSPLSSVRKLLSDTDPVVRALSAKFAGKFKDAESRPRLKEMLSDSDKRAVVNAAYALARAGDNSGFQAVSKIVKSEQDVTIKTLAVEALEAMASPGAVSLLKEMLKDSDEYVKNSARYALIRMRVPLDEPKKK